MADWLCEMCSNVVRGRPAPPSYCPRCGLGRFEQAAEKGRSGSRPPNPQTPTSAESGAPAFPPDFRFRRLTAVLTVDAKPRPERRRARRVRPRARLEARLLRTAPLEVLNISAHGLLVEHSAPFKPGMPCEVELRRSGGAIRLRGEVVRSAVAIGGEKGTGIRYCTAVQFLETPEAILAFLPELTEPS